MDTSQYPKRDNSLRNNFPSIVSKSIDVPQQLFYCHKMDEKWYRGRSEDDEIVVHLLATDEGEKNKIVYQINSNSFLSNFNLEINKIQLLVDGKVTIKSNSQPVVKILTGI